MAAELTIVTATYNDPAGLRKTLSSLEKLIAASFSWDVHVVDSSPDLSKPVLGEFQSRFGLVHIPSPREGVYAAQNLGAARSESQFVWFLNSGDEALGIEPVTAALAALRESANAPMVVAAVEVARPGLVELRRQQPNLPLWRSLLGINRVCHQGVIYRRASLVAAGGFDRRFPIAADYVHLWKTLLKSQAIVVLPDLTLARFELGGASSAIDRAFADFKSAHQALAAEMPEPLQTLNRAAWSIFYARAKAIALVDRTGLGCTLRSIALTLSRKRPSHRTPVPRPRRPRE